jgi:2-hydroxy fatty acid dioxygenase
MSSLIQWFVGGFNTDLMDQLTFYGAYHANPTNQLIHIVFVPAIWFTAAVWLAYVGPAYVNLSLVAFLAYAGYYFALDFNVAIVVNGIYFVLYLLANWIVSSEKKAARTVKRGASAKPTGRPSYRAAKIALVVHVVSWAAQLLSHKYIEGRAAALTQSFVQSLVLAPLFVFYEAAFFLFPGWRVEMQAELHQGIAKRWLELSQKSN